MSTPKLCLEPGCPGLAFEGPRCPRHTKEQERRRVRADPVSRGVYHSVRWRRLRRDQLRKHPFCEWPGCMRVADTVDHVVTIHEAPERAYDPTNLRSLCRSHHGMAEAEKRKSARSLRRR